MKPETNAQGMLIKDVEIYRQNLRKKRKENLENNPQANGFTIQESYVDRILAPDQKYKDYFSVEEDANKEKVLKIDEDKLVKSIHNLMKECFDDESNDLQKLFDTRSKDLADLVANHTSVHDDEKNSLRLDRTIFLYGQLDLLQKLAEEKKSLEVAQERLKQVKAAEDVATAAKSFQVGEFVSRNREAMQEYSAEASKIREENAAKKVKSDPFKKRFAGSIKNTLRHPVDTIFSSLGSATISSATHIAAAAVHLGNAAAKVAGDNASYFTGGSFKRQEEAANDNSQVMVPVNFRTKLQLEQYVRGRSANIEKLRNAITSTAIGGVTPEITANTREDAALSRKIITNTAKSAYRAGKGIIHNTGLWRNSSAINSSEWKEFVDARNKMVDDIRYHPKLASAIGLRKDFIRDQFERGLISAAEYQALDEMVDKREAEADQKHKKRLEALQTKVDEANKDILDKIEKNLDVTDDLYKYKVLHFLILSSVVFPVPLFDVLFDALEPFLGGDLDLSEFLSSFFSVDGPFGKLAWVTDKMELDKLTHIVTDDWFGGIFDSVDSMLDLAKPFGESAGEAASGSPLSPLLLSGILEAVTKSTTKSFDQQVKERGLVSNSKDSLKAKIDALKNSADVENLEDLKAYAKDELKIKGDSYLASKSANWLQEKYQQSPQSCQVFIENVLGEEAKKILDILQQNNKSPDDVNSDLQEYFYQDLAADKTNVLFQQIVQLNKAERTPEDAKEIAQAFGLDFSFQLVDKLKNQYSDQEVIRPNEADVQAAVFDRKVISLYEKDGSLNKDFFDKDGNPKLKEDDGTPNSKLFNADAGIKDEEDLPIIQVVVDGAVCHYQLTGGKNPEMQLNDLKVMSSLKNKLKEKQKASLEPVLKKVNFEKARQDLKDDFMLDNVEQFNMQNGKVFEHNHLPIKIPRILKEESRDELVDMIVEDPLNPSIPLIYGSKIGLIIEELASEFTDPNDIKIDPKKLRAKLTDKIVQEAADKALLVNFICGAGDEIHRKFRDEMKSPSFNFNQFWEENRGDETNPGLGDMGAVLIYEKSLKSLQCLVIQDYMQNNRTGNAEDDRKKAEEYFVAQVFGENFAEQGFELKDLVLSRGDVGKLQKMAAEIQRKYDEKKDVPSEDAFIKHQANLMDLDSNKHTKKPPATPNPTPPDQSSPPVQEQVIDANNPDPQDALAAAAAQLKPEDREILGQLKPENLGEDNSEQLPKQQSTQKVRGE